MKLEIETTRTEAVEISFVELEVPVRYVAEDMPADFPGRKGDMWHVLICIDNGDLHLLDGTAFPGDVKHDLHMKVCDQCTVRMLNHAQEPEHSVEDEYVPGFFPGQHYGDYIIFEIADGQVKNWKPSVSKVAHWLSVKN